jgi:hypothetical protein
MQYITSIVEYFYQPVTNNTSSSNSRDSVPRKLSTEINNFNRETLKKTPTTKTYNYQDNELKRLLGEKFKNVVCETNE